jgi:hypothetical protein
MSTADSLDQLVGDLLAERDERDRARYTALTGRHLPAPRAIRVALGYARVAAEWQRRYDVATPDHTTEET